MNHSSISALILLATITLTGCSDSDSKVVLQNGTGGNRLVYDCKNFQPQVNTPQDVTILVAAAKETIGQAYRDSAVVTMDVINDALKKNDWRTAEREVVMYRCAEKQKQMKK